MMEKINVAEILKKCPSGMELDCALYDNVVFDTISDGHIYPIKIKTPEHSIFLTKNGCYSDNKFSKCVIYPKGKTTWEGFVPPYKFKDGDIVADIEGAVIIYKKITTHNYCGSFVSLDHYNQFIPHYKSYLEDCIRLATEEEKQKLFDAIKDNGYKWNEETNTLEKLPKFKVGDCVAHHKYGKGEITQILWIADEIVYEIHFENVTTYCKANELCKYELVPNKFDITTLKPFDKVLVRNTDKDYWMISMFGYISKGDKQYFMCIANTGFYQCVPYNDKTKHLLGTTDSCDEYYKTWE